MHNDVLFTYATLFGFLYTLARISSVFAFLPLAAFNGAPAPAKIVLSFAFTLLLWPQWKAPFSQAPGSADLSMGRIVAGLAGEMVLGIAIGLAVAVVMEVFQVAAQIASLQAGFGFASTIDPNSGADSTVLLTTAQLTSGLFFFVTGADRMLVRALADSIRLCPPESFVIGKGWADALFHFAGSIFGTGLRLAAPLIALLLLADFTLAVLGRVQTQIHLISLTMPVKLAATMLLISATLVFQPAFFESTMSSSIRLLEQMFRSGANR
jgi:flagellar biosynthetic protein FliR